MNGPTPPSERTGGISWGAGVAIVFVVAAYFVSQAIANWLVLLYPSAKHWSVPQTTHWINSSPWVQFVYIVIAEAIIVAALYAFLRVRRASWRAIGWRRPRWSDFGWGVAFIPVYYLTYLVVVSVVQGFVPHLNTEQAQQIGYSGVHGFGNLAMVFVSLVILPPLVEETLMRGFLYTSLKRVWPKVAAVLATSILFAVAHLEFGSGAPLLWIAFIDTFVLSLYLIYLRDKTGGLWANITLHASKNLIAFVTLLLAHKL